jgi:hypothetical protein
MKILLHSSPRVSTFAELRFENPTHDSGWLVQFQPT